MFTECAPWARLWAGPRGPGGNEIVLSNEEAAQIQVEGTMTRQLGQVLVEQLSNQFSRNMC